MNRDSGEAQLGNFSSSFLFFTQGKTIPANWMIKNEIKIFKTAQHAVYERFLQRGSKIIEGD